MLKKAKKLMRNNRGVGDQYLQMGIGSLIVMMFLYGVIESALLFTSVVKMNNVAELLSKKIQLSGAVNSETQKLLNDCLKGSRIHGYEATVVIQTSNGVQERVTITESGVTTKKIQLNNAYTVVVKGDTKFFAAEQELGGKAVGISEVYSK